MQHEMGIIQRDGDIFLDIVDIYAKANPNSTNLDKGIKFAIPIKLVGVFGQIVLGLLFIYIFAILVLSIEIIYHGYC